MKIFNITEEELNALGNILGELPAKYVVNAIAILQSIRKTSADLENVSSEG